MEKFSSDVAPQEIPQTQQAAEALKGIEIDPEVLKRIQSMRRMHSPPEDFHRRLTSFAGTATGPFVNDYFLNSLREMGIEEFKKKLFEHREVINRSAYKKVPDKFEDIDSATLLYNFLDLMRGLQPRGHGATNDLIEQEQKKFIDDFTDGEKIEAKEKKDEMMEMLKAGLKGKAVVDLGSGDEYFRFAASLCGAKEYVGIDLPFDEKDYGKESEIPGMNETRQTFFPNYNQCKARQIRMDILEALYTKIPDNSSCFVIFGVDETYDLKGDYKNLTNEMIAKKTEVGGIVVRVNSVIGIDMEKNDNFEVIYTDNWMIKIYKRVK